MKNELHAAIIKSGYCDVATASRELGVSEDAILSFLSEEPNLMRINKDIFVIRDIRKEKDLYKAMLDIMFVEIQLPLIEFTKKIRARTGRSVHLETLMHYFRTNRGEIDLYSEHVFDNTLINTELGKDIIKEAKKYFKLHIDRAIRGIRIKVNKLLIEYVITHNREMVVLSDGIIRKDAPLSKKARTRIMEMLKTANSRPLKLYDVVRTLYALSPPSTSIEEELYDHRVNKILKFISEEHKEEVDFIIDGGSPYMWLKYEISKEILEQIEDEMDTRTTIEEVMSKYDIVNIYVLKYTLIHDKRFRVSPLGIEVECDINPDSCETVNDLLKRDKRTIKELQKATGESKVSLKRYLQSIGGIQKTKEDDEEYYKF